MESSVCQMVFIFSVMTKRLALSAFHTTCASRNRLDPKPRTTLLNNSICKQYTISGSYTLTINYYLTLSVNGYNVMDICGAAIKKKNMSELLLFSQTLFCKFCLVRLVRFWTQPHAQKSPLSNGHRQQSRRKLLPADNKLSQRNGLVDYFQACGVSIFLLLFLFYSCYVFPPYSKFLHYLIVWSSSPYCNVCS